MRTRLLRSTMDINTERGRVAALHQIWCVREVLTLHKPGYQYVHTSDTDAAVIDGFVVDPKGQIVAGLEVKSRYNITLEMFMTKMQGRWLLTLQKLNDMQFLAGLLRIPMYGFLYIVPSKIVLVERLVDRDGNIVCSYYAEETETQRTINGGRAIRPNAYIDMNRARHVRLSSNPPKPALSPPVRCAVQRNAENDAAPARR